MSTPTSNSVPVTMLDTSGLGNEGAIIQGVKWGGGWGAGVSLTYSFPNAGGGYHAHPYSYYGDHGEFGSWSSLSASERTAVRSALAEWSAVANISFTEVVDNATTVGDLRFAATTVGGASENAHAYYPWTDPSPGMFGSTAMTGTCRMRPSAKAPTTTSQSCMRSATRLGSSIRSMGRASCRPHMTVTPTRS